MLRLGMRDKIFWEGMYERVGHLRRGNVSYRLELWIDEKHSKTVATSRSITIRPSEEFPTLMK